MPRLLSQASLAIFCFIGLLPIKSSAIPENMTVALLLFSGMCSLVESRRSQTGKKFENLGLTLFIAAAGISFLLSLFFSSSPYLSLKLSTPIAVGLLVGLIVSTEKQSKLLLPLLSVTLCGALLILTAFCSLKALEGGLPLTYASFQDLEVGFLKVPNDILCFVIFWPLVAWSCDQYDRTNYWKREGVKCSYLSLVALLAVLVGSRSTFLLAALCLGRLLSLIGHPASTKPLRVLAPLLCCGALVLWALLPPFFTQDLTRLHLATERIWIWWVGARMIQPSDYLLGIGHGMFSDTFALARHQFDAPGMLATDARHMGWAHNIFIEAWVERGLAGLFTSLALLLAVGQYLLRKRHLCSYNQALFGFLCLLAMTSCFELTLLRTWVCVAFGLLFGLVHADASSAE